MMQSSNSRNRILVGAIALVCAGAVGCHQDSTGPAMVQTPQGLMRDLGTVMVDVDVVHHTVTMHPLDASTTLPAGLSARFFGGALEIEHAPGEQLSTDLGGGVYERNFHWNISNLLTHAIGTNSTHTYPAEPQDTMGVYLSLIHI